MRTTIGMVLVLAATSLANGQSLTVREDVKDGRKPSFTYSLVAANGLRTWGLGANTRTPVWDFGWVTPKPVRLATHLTTMVGGYVSYWQGEKKAYLEPWSITAWRQGKVTVTAKASVYLPVNGGPIKVYSDHACATYVVVPGWSVGLAAGDAWAIDGKKPRAGAGAMVGYQAGLTCAYVRILHGINEPDSLRLEVFRSF